MRTLIVEADGASRGNPGQASYGAVVRDGDTGELLAELAEALGRATNNVAEYRGVIAGLEAARRIDPLARVEVRMDSKLVVEQLSGRWQVKHPDMKPLAERARAAFPSAGVSFTWVPRSQNKHADKLANQALDAAARGEVWHAKTELDGAHDAGAGDAGADSTSADAQSSHETASPDTASPDAASGSSPSAGGTQRARTLRYLSSSAEFDKLEAELAEAAKTSNRPKAVASSTAAVPAAGWSADLGTPTRLLLLRHGVTPLTGEKRFSGLGDPDLIEDGVAQAQAAARRLAGPNGDGDPRYGAIDAIVVSPLRRTRQTAQAVADLVGIEPRVEDGFKELDFGRFEGLTFAEAREQFPRELTAFLKSTKTPAPGGESVADVGARVALARDRTVARFPRQNILIVTHVTPIKVLISQALGAPLEAVHRMELAAASLSVIDFYADGIANVRCVNDTAHL